MNIDGFIAGAIRSNFILSTFPLFISSQTFNPQDHSILRDIKPYLIVKIFSIPDNEVEISNTHKESCQGSGQQTWPHLTKNYTY